LLLGLASTRAQCSVSAALSTAQASPRKIALVSDIATETAKPQPGSKPRRLVHHIIAQCASAGESPAFVHDDLEPPAVEVRPVSGHMWRQQNVRERPQSMATRQRLLFVNIQRRTGDLTRLQRRDQVVQLGCHSAANIDEERGRLHALESGPVEEALSRWGVRHCEDHEICARQQLPRRWRGSPGRTAKALLGFFKMVPEKTLPP
jgi:hypothetical protein